MVERRGPLPSRRLEVLSGTGRASDALARHFVTGRRFGRSNEWGRTQVRRSPLRRGQPCAPTPKTAMGTYRLTPHVASKSSRPLMQLGLQWSALSTFQAEDRVARTLARRTGKLTCRCLWESITLPRITHWPPCAITSSVYRSAGPQAPLPAPLDEAIEGLERLCQPIDRERSEAKARSVRRIRRCNPAPVKLCQPHVRPESGADEAHRADGAHAAGRVALRSTSTSATRPTSAPIMAKFGTNSSSISHRLQGTQLQVRRGTAGNGRVRRAVKCGAVRCGADR